jgi:Starch-binding associating with outer membrane
LKTFAVRNPWAAVARNNAALVLDGWISDNLVKAMNGSRTGIFDPRLRRYTDTTRYGDYRGTPNGKGRVGTGTTRDECYLTVNNYYSADNAPLFIATFEEMKMIEAEAALRANNRARAYTAYNAAIAAHMIKVGVSAADRTTYMAHSSVAVGEANLTLANIFREKYILMFLHPESWVDARRFDYAYPGFTLPQGALLTEPIRRVDWPDSERQRNAANVPAVPPLTQKLWFDKP